MKYIKIFIALLLVLTMLFAVSCTKNTNVDNTTSSSENNGNSDAEPTYSGNYLELSSMDLTPYIELGQYKNATFEVEQLVHTEADIQEQIDLIIESKTTYQQIKVGTVNKGDTVNIDYEGYMDEILFDGGTASDVEIVADDEQSGYIPGFADGLIGANIGDSVTLNIKFPDSYPNSPEKAGKDVKFIVTINYVKGDAVVPELTDEFVSEATNGEITTVEALKEDIAAWVDENLETDNKLFLYESLLALATFKSLPQEHVDYYYYKMVNEATSVATSIGMTYADFIGTQYHYMYYYYGYISFYLASDDEVKKYAEGTTKEELFLFAVASAENITVSDEEYDEYLDKLVAQYVNSGYSYTKEQLEEGIGKIYLKQLILSTKVQSFLSENNTLKLKESK